MKRRIRRLPPGDFYDGETLFATRADAMRSVKVGETVIFETNMAFHKTPNSARASVRSTRNMFHDKRWGRFVAAAVGHDCAITRTA